MKYVVSFGIILLFTLLGEILKAIIPLPIPASIYGMVLLFLALQLKFVKIETVNRVAQQLISMMLLFFVIPAVSIMDSFSLLAENLVSLVIVTIVTTMLVVVVTGRVTQRMERLTRKWNQKGQEDDKGNIE